MQYNKRRPPIEKLTPVPREALVPGLMCIFWGSDTDSRRGLVEIVSEMNPVMNEISFFNLWPEAGSYMKECETGLLYRFYYLNQ